MTVPTFYALVFCVAAATEQDCLLIAEGLPKGCQVTMAFMAPVLKDLDGAFHCLPEGSL